MILSLVVILFTGLIAYLWSTRGFFSSLLHMACTLVAGAIAFAVWEPVGYWLIGMAPKSGFLRVLEDAAWGLALAAPFAVALVLLRTLTDIFLGANVIVGRIADYVGGAVCGIVSAVISVGILVLSMGMLRFNQNFLGYQPIEYANNGSLVRENSLILPVDRITAGLYSQFSTTTLATSQPLARWHPDFADLGATMRMNQGGGRSRVAIKPDEFGVVGRFIVGGQGVPLSSILTDALDPTPQQVSMLDGSPYPADSRIEGFVVRFSAGANESTGKVNVGPAQVRLIVENADGTGSRALHPIAVSSQASSEALIFGRWRFDAADVFISSVGGAAESFFAFEFIVPPGMQPIALQVRGARALLDTSVRQLATFPTGAARDAALARLPQFVQGGGGASLAGNLDTSTAQTVRRDANNAWPQGLDIRIGRALGFTIQKGIHAPLIVNDENFVEGGEKVFTTQDIQGAIGLERTLRVDQFVDDPDTVIVQIEVGGVGPASLLNPVVNTLDRDTAAPVLIDNLGQAYTPIGFILDDTQFVKVRFMPSEPLTSLAMLDDKAKRLSRSSLDDKLRLIYRVSKGVRLQHFAVGNRVLVTFNPTLGSDGS